MRFKVPGGGRRRGRSLLLATAMAAAALPAGGAISASPAGKPAPGAGEEPQTTGRAFVLVDQPGSDDPTPSAGVVAETRDLIRDVVDDANLDAEQKFPELGTVLVDTPRGGIAAVRRRVASDPDVTKVEPEFVRHTQLTPNDPAFTDTDFSAPNDADYQWHLRKEKFKGAWNRSKGGKATVAVIDTGTASHPDLNDRIRSRTLQGGGGSASSDENGHGTHVSGLACGDGGNRYGIVGAGYNCRIRVEKAGDEEGGFSDGDIVDSIRHAADRRVDVINMSFGGSGESTSIRNAIDYAFDRDVVLVAANSNKSGSSIPARYLQPNGRDIDSGKGLAVTAAEYNRTRANFGSGPHTGNDISLAAFGDSSLSTRGIFSTFPGNTTRLDTGGGLLGDPPCGCRTTFRGDNRFAYLAGTSMATPQVAGAAALIRSRRPGMSPRRVAETLKRAAKGSSYSSELGWGILNANRALKKAL